MVNLEAERLGKEGFDERPGPEKLLINADGSFIRLTNGEWREVNGLAVGEFETVNEAPSAVGQVKTKKLSYFTRSYQVRDFETYALAELARRGIDQAATVVNERVLAPEQIVSTKVTRTPTPRSFGHFQVSAIQFKRLFAQPKSFKNKLRQIVHPY